MTVYGFYGFKGSGKTLSMVLLAYILYLSGKKIISNIRLFFPFEWIDVKDIVELSPNLENAVVLLDEIHMIADSRQPTSLQNRCITYFFLQSRHRNCDILYTTQQAGQGDIRIRKNTDVKVICENLKLDSDGDGEYDIFKMILNNVVDRIVVEKIIYGFPVFSLYNSKEIVNPFVYINKQELKEMFSKNTEYQQLLRSEKQSRKKK